jgi:hypothetical protein
VLAIIIFILDLVFLPFMGPEIQEVTGFEAHPLLELLMGMLLWWYYRGNSSALGINVLDCLVGMDPLSESKDSS